MKTYSLSIPKPCSERWENFTPTDGGGFCSSCDKVVIDFTKMTDQQVIDFIQQKPAHACGRFRSSQLKQYHQFDFAKVKPGYLFLKAGALSALLLLTSRPSNANTPAVDPPQTVQVASAVATLEIVKTPSGYYVRGVVIAEEDKLPMPGVNVQIKGRYLGTTTDINGRFEIFERLEEGTVIVFSFIGYQTLEYVVSEKNSDFVEIALESDYQLTGELLVGGMYSEPSGLKAFWSKVKALF